MKYVTWYLQLHTHTHVYTYVYTHVYTHKHIYFCMCVRVCTYPISVYTETGNLDM